MAGFSKKSIGPPKNFARHMIKINKARKKERKGNILSFSNYIKKKFMKTLLAKNIYIYIYILKNNCALNLVDN